MPLSVFQVSLGKHLSAKCAPTQKWPSKWKASLVFSSFLAGPTKSKAGGEAGCVAVRPVCTAREPSDKSSAGALRNLSPGPGFSAPQKSDNLPVPQRLDPVEDCRCGHCLWVSK